MTIPVLVRTRLQASPGSRARRREKDDEFALYATADVVISLSSVESFGLVVLEGLASEARVMASDIPAQHMATFSALLIVDTAVGRRSLFPLTACDVAAATRLER